MLNGETQTLPLVFRSLTAAHLPRPGLAGLRAGEDGLHAEQQAQSDLPGAAVGVRARRAPAGGGRLRGLSRGFFSSSRVNSRVDVGLLELKFPFLFFKEFFVAVSNDAKVIAALRDQLAKLEAVVKRK